LRSCTRASEIIEAIQLVLAKAPFEKTNLIRRPNTYLKIFTPEISPPVEIRVKYIASDENDKKVLITGFQAIL
jgi:hypothetical protein